MNECWSICGQKTLFAVVGDLLQVYVVRSNNCRLDRVCIAQLNLDALAEWWKHFGKDQLLVPHWSICILFNRRFALKKSILQMKHKHHSLNITDH